MKRHTGSSTCVGSMDGNTMSQFTIQFQNLQATDYLEQMGIESMTEFAETNGCELIPSGS